MRSDLSVYDKSNRLILVVEVKKNLGVSIDWAAQYRRNLFAHGTYPQTLYFLLATPDKLFLWYGDNNAMKKTKPDNVIDTRFLFEPYLNETSFKLEEISEQGLEFIVAAWLNDLTHSAVEMFSNEQTKSFLIDSGLASAIEGGRYAFEEAA